MGDEYSGDYLKDVLAKYGKAAQFGAIYGASAGKIAKYVTAQEQAEYPLGMEPEPEEMTVSVKQLTFDDLGKFVQTPAMTGKLLSFQMTKNSVYLTLMLTGGKEQSMSMSSNDDIVLITPGELPW